MATSAAVDQKAILGLRSGALPQTGRLSRFFPLISLFIFAAGIWVLHRELAGHHIADVLRGVRDYAPAQIVLALAFTAASYTLLIGYDWLAIRHVGKVLPLRQIALTSFISFAVSLNLGVAVLTGGSLRLRFYSRAGLSAIDVAVVVAFLGLAIALGLGTLAGLTFLFEPPNILAAMGLPLVAARLIGLGLLGSVAAYLAVAAFRKRPLKLFGYGFKIPNVRVSLAQLIISIADIGFAAAVLFVLLPSEINVSFLGFVGLFVLAAVAGTLSHVPGGIGVFEAVLLLLLPQIPAGELVAAMLAYRFIYYILPLIAAAILLGGMGLPAVGRLSPKLNEAWQTTQAMLPQVLGVLTFLSGAVMLLSTATPAVATRMQFLHEVLPLSLVETSHLLSSGLGFALLVLGRGLFRRLNGAYWLSILALLAGVILSLLKGLDFEEAVALAAVLLLLIPARRAFYRRASLMTPSISPGWLVAMATVVLSTAWLGLASFRQVDLMSGLWFNFAFADDASRFLRASLVVAVLASCFALWRLLRGAAPEGFPDAGSADQAIREIVRGSDDPDAALALTGDKRFLVHESGHSMIMYGVAGRSWISMGDPLGPREEWEDLLWKFRELSDRYDGRIVFYQVGESSLRFYADAGLSVLKIGEEAVVSLPDFTLKGSARAKLRQAVARAERDGASFRVALPPHDEKLMNSLGEISDQWLADKNAAEKRFSVGRFDPAYLASQPIALVEVGGDIVAFANIWASNPDGEFSIDLMRHTTGSPDGVMDYLFVSLIQWGRAQGFASFNLGMAPLSGLTSHPLAPTWQRLGAAIFRHGEYFYNFEGLRRYKEKFHPEWRPRYIATPPGLALPHMLLDVTKLISGGLRGIISR